MFKTAIIKMVKINYSGDSVGEDIKVEVETPNNFVAVDKKIKNGSSIELNTEIGQFTADESLLLVPITIRVIEKDRIFNDVGFIMENIKINFDSVTTQKIEYKVEVHESRGYKTNKVGKFNVSFEINIVHGVVRYVGEGKGGWLEFINEKTKKLVSLPTHLKVRLERSNSQREYCTILEGAYYGAAMSIKFNENGKSYLPQNDQRISLPVLSYSISKKLLKFKNKKYIATDDSESPWKKGLYDVEIPDSPHGGGLHYPSVKYATWDNLCKVLMKGRKGDGKSIGTLEVID